MKQKMKRILGLALALVMIISSFPLGTFKAYAEGGVEINETNFPDPFFRKYVSKNFDGDRNGTLSQVECDAVNQIDVKLPYFDRGNIESLKGIENFKNLKILDCTRNWISSLDLSQNTALTELKCSQNELTKLDVSNNTALTKLDCDHNYLTELDVSNNTALTELYCYSNRIRELDVSNNTALTVLRCGGNRIRELDVSNNTALILLECSNNYLTELDVSNNTALGLIDCSNNYLTEVDVTNNTSLESLYVSANPLTGIDLSKNKDLLEINADHCQLTGLDLSANSKLSYINGEGNPWTSIELPANPDPSVDLHTWLKPKYVIVVPTTTNELTFPEGFDTTRVVGTIQGIKIQGNKLLWDRITMETSFDYKLFDGSDETEKVTVQILPYDPGKAVSMQVKIQPKLTYTEGDELDLSGLVVTLTYKGGIEKDVAFKDFNDYGIRTFPANGRPLIAADNGKPVQLTLGSLTAETNALNVKAKVFDPTNVKGMEVTTEPTLSYTEGEKLNLAGLVVTLWDKKGKIKDVAFADFATYDITATPADQTTLTLANNGKKVELKKGDLTAVTDALIVNAKPTTDTVVPWVPGKDEEPTTGKDGGTIPAGYVTVTFKSEAAAKGKVKVGTKEGVEVKAKVKPDTDLSTRTDIKAVAEDGYGFTAWNPTLGVAQTTEPYVAKFIKSGDEVGANDPIPSDWHRVTVKQDADSIQAGTVAEKTYAVAPNDKLAANKFPNLDGREATNYENPAWYVGGTKEDNPADKAITAETTFIAKADKKAEVTKEDVVPWVPGKDEEPTTGKDGGTIPAGYITVTFKSEAAAKGKVKVGTKEGVEVKAKVKPNTNLEGQAEAVAEDGYGFTVWAPKLGVAQATEPYVAKFIKSGDEVGANDPIPSDWHRVTVKQDADSIQAGTVSEKTYAVAPNDKLAANKFPNLDGKEATNYENPAWYVDGTKEDNPAGKAITAETTFIAKADKKAEVTKEDVVPWVPGKDEEPTTGKDGGTIPAGYVTVTFKSEAAAKGKVKVGDKEGAIVKAKVKPDTDLEGQAEAVAEDGYGFTAWDPALGVAADGKEYTAKFIKSGDEVGANDPIPADWHRVTVKQDADSIQANTVEEKTYAVAPNDKLAANKFPALTDKEAQGYENPAWYVGGTKVDNPADKAITDATTFIAKADKKVVETKEDVVPWVPGTDTEPTTGKDGGTIPAGYVTVTFKSEAAAKGKVKVGEKEGAEVKAKVKPGTDLTDKAEAVAETGYGFTKWDPVLGAAADGKEYTAKFIKSGDEVGANDPIPADWHRVTVKQDADSIQANTVEEKTYAVAPNDKLAADKFPALTDKAAEGYENPAWYVGGTKVDNPADKAITDATTFIAKADKKVVETKEDVVPWVPGTDTEPTTGKDGGTIPAGYVTVTFKSEAAAKGKVKVGEKEGAEVKAKVKPGTDLTDKAEAVAETGYGFTKWNPVLGAAADGNEYTAKFIKSGDEVKANDPIPSDWHRVTVKQDADSIQANTVEEKTYAVAPNDKLAADKFPALTDKAAEGYENPAWYVGGTKVDNPAEKAITAETTFIAKADQKAASGDTTDEVVPYLPGEGEPTTGKDGGTIPAGYITVTFKSEAAAKGKVKVGDKKGEVVKAKVKPGTNLTDKAEAVAETGYGFTKWDPALGVAADGKEYTAKFIKSGDEVKANDPIPSDWHRVTVKQDADSIQAGTVSEKTYAVAPNDKLAAEKFPALTDKEAQGYENPAWYVGGTKEDNPAGKAITAETTFIAKADQKAASGDTTDEVVPYLPGEGEPTTGKDGKTIPTDYITVTFKSEDGTKGKVKVGDKEGVEVRAKVKPNTDLARKAEAVAKDGYSFTAWDPALGVAADGKEYTAKFNATGGSGQVDPTTEPVVPYLPSEGESTKDKDGKTIPAGYVTVTFKSEDESKGKVKVGDKEGAVVKAKVKPDTDLSTRTDIKAVAETGYGFTKWDPELGIAADGNEYTAKFNATGGSGTGGSGWIFVPTPGPSNPSAKNSSDSNKNVPKNRATSISMAYIFGYEDGTFRPDGSITRAEAAAMLARLAKLDTSDSSRPNFIDVRSGWYNGVINAMVKAGYMKGYPDGTFRPNGKITRAELAQMIVAIDKANRSSAPFADVKGHWALPAIEQAYANGRIKGYPDGSFRPNNSITRAESVAIFNSLFDRHVSEKGLVNVRSDIKNFKDTSSNHWAYFNIVAASNTAEVYYADKNKNDQIWVRVIQN